jgi:RNA recognition motif-containing protein
MTKLMVENLPANTTESSLTELFAQYGKVQQIDLATDVMTGRCGGFGFINLDEICPGEAIFALDGKFLGNRALRVTLERKRESYDYGDQQPNDSI